MDYRNAPYQHLSGPSYEHIQQVQQGPYDPVQPPASWPHIHGGPTHQQSLKSTPLSHVQQTQSYQPIQSTYPWRPGALARLPWLGLLALIGGFLCAIASAVVLISSNGKSTNSWPVEGASVQPNVILAVLTAGANAMFLFAMQEGATIAWWLKMLNGGNIGDCHRYWECSVSLWASALSGRHFNKIALACLMMAVVVVDGPLLQRASSVSTRQITSNVNFPVELNPEPFPHLFSAVYMTRAKTLSMLTPSFSKVVQGFTSKSTMAFNYTGCEGTCTGELIAPGFDVHCSSHKRPYNITANPGQVDQVGYATVSFAGTVNPAVINVTTAHKPRPDVIGDLDITNCTLQIAQVRYPVQIANGSVTLRDPDPAVNYTIKGMYNMSLETSGLGVWPSSIGGFAFAASTIYGSNVSVYFTGVYAVEGTGPMSSTYLNSDQKSLGTSDMTWADPTQDILMGIRELAFRAAISNSNSSTKQTVQGTESSIDTYYVAHFRFLAGALAVMLLTAFVIAPLFFGWWLLGRAVSLSPVETAKAFRAPLLKDGGCNSDVDTLLSEVGSRKARYGAVMVSGSDGLHGQKGHSVQTMYLGAGVGEELDTSGARLEIADPGSVIWPVTGALYRE